MEIHVHVNKFLGFVDFESLTGIFLLDRIFFDLFLQKLFDLMNDMHATLFSGGLSPPDENFPEKQLLSSSSDVFGVLESFMENMFIENGEDVFFDTSQKLIKVIV